MKDNTTPTPSRRQFIASVLSASTVALLGASCARGRGFDAQGNDLQEKADTTAGAELDPRVAGIVVNTLGIDTHNHIDVPLIAAEVPGPNIDLASELKRSGLSAICMTFAVDYQRLDTPDAGYERFKNGLASMDQQLERNKMKRALNLADLRAAHEKGLPIVVQSVEGGHFLNGKLERLEEAYRRGLRHLGLLHDNDASVPLGDVFTNPPRYGGLTAFGREVIQECNRLGILVDLGHANAETVAAALKVATKPVIISHTGLDTQVGTNEFMARMMKPRLISKEQAKLVADTGGVIGVWTHLADSATQYAQNVRALVDVVGIDHVCIGTDTKLTPAYNPPSERGGPGGQRGFGGRDGGRGQGTPSNGGDGTNHTWPGQTVGFYYTVVDAMLKNGFTPNEIGKFGGGNFCRLFDKSTAGAR